MFLPRSLSSCAAHIFDVFQREMAASYGNCNICFCSLGGLLQCEVLWPLKQVHYFVRFCPLAATLNQLTRGSPKRQPQDAGKAALSLWNCLIKYISVNIYLRTIILKCIYVRILYINTTWINTFCRADSAFALCWLFCVADDHEAHVGRSPSHHFDIWIMEMSTMLYWLTGLKHGKDYYNIAITVYNRRPHVRSVTWPFRTCTRNALDLFLHLSVGGHN